MSAAEEKVFAASGMTLDAVVDLILERVGRRLGVTDLTNVPSATLRRVAREETQHLTVELCARFLNRN